MSPTLTLVLLALVAVCGLGCLWMLISAIRDGDIDSWGLIPAAVGFGSALAAPLVLLAPSGGDSKRPILSASDLPEPARTAFDWAQTHAAIVNWTVWGLFTLVTLTVAIRLCRRYWN